jgi:hypothetical protein
MIMVIKAFLVFWLLLTETVSLTGNNIVDRKPFCLQPPHKTQGKAAMAAGGGLSFVWV